MTHNNLDGWTQHLQSHIAFLRQMLEEGSLRASGPLPEAPVRGGFLIVKADTRAAVDALIARDPFSTEGLIDGLIIQEWDPLFGAFAAESSGATPNA